MTTEQEIEVAIKKQRNDTIALHKGIDAGAKATDNAMRAMDTLLHNEKFLGSQRTAAQVGFLTGMLTYITQQIDRAPPELFQAIHLQTALLRMQQPPSESND